MTTTPAPTTQAPHAPQDELELVSMYLALPVERVHGLVVRLGPEVRGMREGTLVVDPNTCGLDGWGDRTWCTRIALREIAVGVTRMDTPDPAGLGRVLHRVESPEFPGEVANLIEHPDAGLWYGVYDQKDGRTLVIPLFSAQRLSPDVAGDAATPVQQAPRQG